MAATTPSFRGPNTRHPTGMAGPRHERSRAPSDTSPQHGHSRCHCTYSIHRSHGAIPTHRSHQSTQGGHCSTGGTADSTRWKQRAARPAGNTGRFTCLLAGSRLVMGPMDLEQGHPGSHLRQIHRAGRPHRSGGRVSRPRWAQQVGGRTTGPAARPPPTANRPAAEPVPTRHQHHHRGTRARGRGGRDGAPRDPTPPNQGAPCSVSTETGPLRRTTKTLEPLPPHQPATAHRQHTRAAAIAAAVTAAPAALGSDTNGGGPVGGGQALPLGQPTIATPTTNARRPAA